MVTNANLLIFSYYHTLNFFGRTASAVAPVMGTAPANSKVPLNWEYERMVALLCVGVMRYVRGARSCADKTLVGHRNRQATVSGQPFVRIVPSRLIRQIRTTDFVPWLSVQTFASLLPAN